MTTLKEILEYFLHKYKFDKSIHIKLLLFFVYSLQILINNQKFMFFFYFDKIIILIFNNNLDTRWFQK